jgi:dephospho-CoA kinase
MSMLHVGLTGNVASGKSTVAARLAHRGATVLDADRHARQAIAPGTAALARVIARFGLDANRALDRAALGRMVFRDAAARRDLEAIVHPEVAQLRAEELSAARARGEAIVVSDVPLLFEAGLEKEFDAIVLVHAPAPVRLARLQRDRHLSEEEARATMAAQGDPEAKRSRATWVIENDGSVAELEAKVDALWSQITAWAHRA